MAPTTHVVTMPTCVYKYRLQVMQTTLPRTHINFVKHVLNTWFERHDNVDPTSTLQLDKSPEESLTKTKPQVGKSGL